MKDFQKTSQSSQKIITQKHTHFKKLTKKIDQDSNSLRDEK